MNDLYNRIEALCKERGTNITEMCRLSGAPRGSMTDLKKGRIATLTTGTLSSIATYFGISTDYLLGTETEKAPTQEGERQVSDDDIMFALWGGSDEMDAEDLADVKRYAAFIQERKQKK